MRLNIIAVSVCVRVCACACACVCLWPLVENSLVILDLRRKSLQHEFCRYLSNWLCTSSRMPRGNGKAQLQQQLDFNCRSLMRGLSAPRTLWMKTHRQDTGARFHRRPTDSFFFFHSAEQTTQYVQPLNRPFWPLPHTLQEQTKSFKTDMVYETDTEKEKVNTYLIFVISNLCRESFVSSSAQSFDMIGSDVMVKGIAHKCTCK